MDEEVARITAFTCDIGEDGHCRVDIFIEYDTQYISNFDTVEEVLAFLETNLDQEV